MALNPPISQNGVPFRVEGEFFVLERKNIECEFKIDNLGTKTGKGKVRAHKNIKIISNKIIETQQQQQNLITLQLFLTTARMVFVHDKFSTHEFKAFDIPIAFL